MTRWRRLSSSFDPTALSVRNTNVPAARQAADRVIRVDPRVHARRRLELGARRPQLRGDDARVRSAGDPSRRVHGVRLTVRRPRRRPRSDSRTHNYTELHVRRRSHRSRPFRSRRPVAGRRARQLRRALGGGARLLVKRDDAIGVRVRRQQGAEDAARRRRRRRPPAPTRSSRPAACSRTTRGSPLPRPPSCGMKCILVVNGDAPGASDRQRAARSAARRRGALRRGRARSARRRWSARPTTCAERGGRPFVIPLGASTPLGAAAFVAAIAELRDQIDPPDVIIHASSSGGTQAGLVAGCALAGWPTRVIGISADEPAASLESTIRDLLGGLGTLLDCGADRFASASVEVDDGFVGEGYGIPTDGVARSDGAGRADAKPCLSIDLHCQGHGRPDRARPRWRVPEGRHRALLAHRRTGGALRVNVRSQKLIS